MSSWRGSRATRSRPIGGATGPASSSSARPSLLIPDVRPGGEERGRHVLRALARDPATRPIPVIVCSAAVAALREREPRLRRAGVAVLPKPFELDDLLGKIRSALSAAGS